MEKGGLGTALRSHYRRLSRVELDHQVGFHRHRVGNLVKLRHAGEAHLVIAVRRDVIGNLALGQASVAARIRVKPSWKLMRGLRFFDDLHSSGNLPPQREIEASLQ